jgi:S-DNA-T family DNA segregation ATPase FtsK/SpoIIIE
MNQYETAASRIEQVLIAHHLNVRVWQAQVLPAVVRFKATIAMGQRADAVTRLAAELAMALDVSSVRIERVNGAICIDVPRKDRRDVQLDPLFRRFGRRNCAALGLDATGKALMLALDSPDVPHTLISGMTGSGKTELLRTIVASLTMLTKPKSLSTNSMSPVNHPGLLQILVCDIAGNLADLCPERYLWQGRAPAATSEECVTALAYAASKIDRRREHSLPRLVIVIDELADLLAQAPSVMDSLLRLTQRGRQAAINVVAATQRPAAVLVAGIVKANFTVRIVGSVASPEDAKLASGRAGTGAERLLGRGDFLLVARGQEIRFQAARVPPGPRIAVEKLPRWEPSGNRYHNRVAKGRTDGSTTLAPVTANRLPWCQPDTDGVRTIRRVYDETGSLSATCRAVYGAKNGRVWDWVRHAVAPPGDAMTAGTDESDSQGTTGNAIVAPLDGTTGGTA